MTLRDFYLIINWIFYFMIILLLFDITFKYLENYFQYSNLKFYKAFLIIEFSLFLSIIS